MRRVTRKYDMTRRAAGVEETRLRIIRAAVALHEELGPARTTVKAIAERAGVQRLTVYRHFPDEVTMLTACSSHWAKENPPPRFSSWTVEDDPTKRLRLALEAFYSYYASEEKMIANSFRDAPLIPFVAAQMQRFEGYLDKVKGDLLRNWKVRGRAGRNLANLLAHALRFETWRSLKQQGLSTSRAAELMTAAVAGVARK
jgi:AcrR family transcriptional regulator